MSDLTKRLHRPAGRWAAAALVLATLLAVLVGAPAPGPGLLAVGAVAAGGHRLVSHRRRGGLDRLIVGVGAILVGIVLTGMVLAVLGVELRPSTWTVGLAALVTLSLVVDLAVSARQPTPSPVEDSRAHRHRHTLLRVVPWVAASVIVVVAAVGLSARSLTATDQAPLAMSFSKVDGTDVQVVVRGGEAVGPLELRTTTGGTDVSYPLFDVGADGSRTVSLSLPRHGRFTITLNNPDQTQPLRTLILDR